MTEIIDRIQLDAAITEVARLRKGIQDYLHGNYIGPRSYRHMGAQTKCPHGMFYWDSCEGCIDDHFAALLGVALTNGERGGA
jgi:hypothetical protein